MNDYDPNNMSRSNRPKNKKIEPKFARTSDSKSENKGLRVALIVLGLVILSAFPVYGFFSNHKGSTPQTVSSSSQHKSSTKKSSSSTSTSSETTSSDSSVSSSSQSEEVAVPKVQPMMKLPLHHQVQHHQVLPLQPFWAPAKHCIILQSHTV